MPLGIVARVFGIIFLIAGILGFVPSLVVSAPEAAHLVIGTTGFLLGIFPVNVLHNIVHAFVGLWGLVAGRGYASARSYFRAIALLYALLVVLGLIPLTNTFFAMIPIFGSDVWLHVIAAIAAGYFGFGTPALHEGSAEA
jgi:hypothetical protein